MASVLLNFQACNLQLYKIRGVPRTPTISKVELFKTLVNRWNLVTNDTKSSISDVAGVLDAPLKICFIIGIYQGFSPHVKNRCFQGTSTLQLFCPCDENPQIVIVKGSFFSIVAGLQPTTSQNKLCHRFISMVYTTGSLQNWMIMLSTFYAFDIFTFVNSLHSHLTFFMV